jgi:hypothetical protein
VEVFCGIDWAEDHHDVALVDATGNVVGKRRIGDDAAGFTQLLQLLAEAGDSAEDPIPVASRPTVACWSPACAPPDAASTRSTRKPWTATATGTA